MQNVFFSSPPIARTVRPGAGPSVTMYGSGA